MLLPSSILGSPYSMIIIFIKLPLLGVVDFIAYLNQDTGELALDGLKVKVTVVTNDDLDVEGLSTSLDDSDGLGVAVLIDKEGVLLVLGCSPAHDHGLGSSGTLIQKRGVGNRHSGEVGDHGLVVEERLETALGNLGLVGGVLSVPVCPCG